MEKKKGDKNTQMLRDIQMLTHVHQTPTLLTKQQNDQDNKCTRHDCEPRDTFAAPNQTSERGSHQKQKKNRINAKFSRVGTFVRYTTRDVLKSTVKIEIR